MADRDKEIVRRRRAAGSLDEVPVLGRCVWSFALLRYLEPMASLKGFFGLPAGPAIQSEQAEVRTALAMYVGAHISVASFLWLFTVACID